MSSRLLVVGGGPGGYTAAFRAADLGLEVTLVERHATLGGVCLNVGCIPSKALLHVAKVISDAEQAAAWGVGFARPEIDLDAMRTWKEGVIERLTGGLAGMAARRKVTVIQGAAELTGGNEARVGEQLIEFDHAILATGSSAARLPGQPEDERVIGSTGALALRDIPGRLLVVGGGVIGLELAGVYDALGSRVTVVELSEQLMPGCDPDLLVPLQKRIESRYEAIELATTVAALEATTEGMRARLQKASGDDGGSREEVFDRVLVAIGRVPNSGGIGLENAVVETDARGFVRVDSQLRTNVPNIHAIGDLVGPPMLAHKATHEAKVAAEVIAGEDVELEAHGIPAVAYTDPEVAWVGLTETEAKAQGLEYRTVKVPWGASGRALASDAAEGLTKLILEPGSSRLLGAGICGLNAGELIAEAGLGLELEVDTQDIALTVHAHPTLAETLALAAELAEGTATDLPPARRPVASGGARP